METTRYDDIEPGDRVKVEFTATVVEITADGGGWEFLIDGVSKRARYLNRTFWDDVALTKVGPPMPDHSCVGYGTFGGKVNVPMYYDRREGTISRVPSGEWLDGVTDFREATP